ncbi:SusC/RagA family TonB-linked outer membrane protein [Parafilimonas terrae]|uniref:TonB-linked outer membrane protein, SusC/RagA family n=1 Tax=Parafilimonas terrae TaxID=1465490 RepID=A0A1I5VK17_9BACT|nr:SusC/RagA family TonB-linked outer membrane protein [Parafilimonas terrae]SFQ07326.1 TonB-linked outer membrane protein, SusC/RagA family [Parafilimonas terrae]
MSYINKAAGLLLCLLLCVCSHAGQLTVKVTDASNNQPVAGAEVHVAGSSYYSLTDTSGFASIPAGDKGGRITVKALGYATATAAFSQADTDIQVRLVPAGASLETVTVSTGYQLLPKERATGSFATIDSAALGRQVTTGITDRLKGAASGLLFDGRLKSSSGLNVRGISSINGPSAPLIILDNFPYEGDINNINPNNIESITLLKDAAAASIWGAKAGNGVIVMTTKKGAYNQPLRLELNASLTYTAKPDVYKAQDFMNSAGYIEVEQMLFDNDFYSYYESSPFRPALSPVVETLIQQRDGLITPAQAAARLDTLGHNDVRRDFDRYIYKSSLQQQYALSLSGGGDKARYLLSAGYNANADALSAGYNRYSFSGQNDLQPFKALTLHIGFMYTRSKATSGKPGWDNIIPTAGRLLYPYTRLADDEGRPLAITKDYPLPYVDTAGGGLLKDWHYYPLDDYRHNTTTSGVEDLLLDVNTQLRLLPWLKAGISYRYEKQHTTGLALQDAESYYARNMVNSYTQAGSDGSLFYAVPPGGIAVNSYAAVEGHALRAQADIDKRWNNMELTALAGAEVRQTASGAGSYTLYGYDDATLSYTPADVVNSYPLYVSGYSDYINPGTGLSSHTDRFLSGYINAALSYRSRYTISASARKDASNLFGAATNNRGTPLWSAGGAWQLNREPWWQAGWLPLLRLRASYGFTGDVDQQRSAVTTLSIVPGASYTNYSFANISQFANPGLRWEKTGMLNAGVDFAMKDNLLAGSIEYYHKHGTDLLGYAPLDYTSGLRQQAIIKNTAAMKGDGVDATLNSTLLKAPLSWQVTLYYGYNLSKTTRYYRGESALGSDYVSDGNIISAAPGKPLYAVASYKWAGLDPQTGDPRGWLDGKPSTDYAALLQQTMADDLVYTGSGLPVHFGYFNNSFSYRQWSLTISISYKLGYWFRKASVDYGQLYNYGYMNRDFEKRWQQPGDEKHTSVPSLVYPYSSFRDQFYNNSEALVVRGDHIRLQYIYLVYNMAPGQKHRMFSNAQLYLNVLNAGILWRANKEGLDPDRYYPNQLPVPFSLAGGIKITF